MPPRSYLVSPPTNPVLQVLYFVLGGLLLIGAVLLGAVILAIALGIALIAGLIIFARVWWLKRKLVGAGARQRSGPSRTADRGTIEVEYKVINERDDPDRRD